MTNREALALPPGAVVGIIGPPSRYFNETSRQVTRVIELPGGAVLVALASRTTRREDDYLAGPECVTSLAAAAAWRRGRP